jgi:pimeloyl-ACP methyl ester carboxylesterase
MPEQELLRHAADAPDGRPPLLFVHGAWHGAWCWADHWLPWFAARGWNCAAVSLRGHGGSPLKGSLSAVSIGAYLDDVQTAATRLPNSPVLIGHSLGGFLVQKALERRTFPAAVLLAPVPVMGSLPALMRSLRAEPATILGAALSIDAGQIVGSRRLARRTLFSEATPAVTVRHAFERLGGESIRAIVETALVPPKAKAIRARNVPLLVVAAGDDDLFRVTEQRRTAGALSADFALVEGSGHDVMLDTQWEEAARVVHDWLEINVILSGVKVR